MIALRSLRENKNISQTKLASMVNIKSNTLSQYESGKRSPNIDTLKKLAKVLKCSVDDLIKEE